MAEKLAKIKFLKSPDFRTNYVTGIYGGVSPNGLLNLNFFIDRVTLPDYQTLEITDDGVAAPNVVPKDVKDADIVREVQCGVMINIETAKSVIKWMEARILEIEKRTELIENHNKTNIS